LKEVFPAWPLAEHIQREGSSSPLGLGKDPQQETVILYNIKIANGDKITKRFRFALEI
jgi:hypothetical protein